MKEISNKNRKGKDVNKIKKSREGEWKINVVWKYKRGRKINSIRLYEKGKSCTVVRRKAVWKDEGWNKDGGKEMKRESKLEGKKNEESEAVRKIE